MESIVKQIFGDLVWQNAALQAQLAEAQKKNAELEKQLDERAKAASDAVMAKYSSE